MDVCEFGVATLHTRVERWECDYNNHWNTRFYGRSFQLAAEVVAARYGGPKTEPATPQVRHIRFHRELFVSDTVEVRSAVLNGGGDMDGAVVHVLARDGVVSATALDVNVSASRLPQVSADDVSFALPRGISGDSIDAWADSDSVNSAVELGLIRPHELDHAGELLFEQLIGYGSIASNVQLNRIGFTPEFSEQTGVARMAVELRAKRFASPPAGTPVCGQSRICRVEDKSFRADHRIMTINGDVIATLEFCLVTVDINTRRAIPVPNLVREAWHKE